MIGAIFHRLLQRWIFRVPSANLSRLPLFSISDIPLWIVLRGDWLRHMRKLIILQRNLKTKDWSSLGIVYPRLGVLAYSFYLFSWAEYCHQTHAILTHPDNCLFAEVFLSYICQIDMLIDQPDTQHLWDGNNIREIKFTAQIQNTASELTNRILTLSIPRSRQVKLIKQITCYRRHALQTMRQWATCESQTLAEVLADKQVTACGLLPEWSNLLNIAYDIPEKTAQSVNAVFLNFSFLVQIIDDIADAAADYRNHVQNIFIAVVQQTEPEWMKLHAMLDQHIEIFGWRWIRKNLPRSYQTIQHLYGEYAVRLTNDEHRPDIVQAMFQTIDRYRSLMELNQ